MQTIVFGLALSLCAAVRDAAANVIVVDAAGGPGSQYTKIQLAVNAAQEGDILLIRSGVYEPATILDKSLTLVANGPGATSINTSNSFAPLVVANLSAGKRVVLRGLEIGGGEYIGITWGSVALSNDAGTVWLDSCKFGISPIGAAITVNTCTDVVITDCDVHGGNGFYTPFGSPDGAPALAITASNVTAHASTFTGGDGIDGFDLGASGAPTTDGKAAVKISGGAATLTDCTLTGGQGGNGHFDFGVVFCYPAGAGGAALVLDTGSPVVRLAADVLVAGAVGTSVGTCTPPPPTATIVIATGSVVSLNGTPGDLHVDSPLRETHLTTLTVTRASGDAAWLLESANSASVLLQQYAGVLHVGAPTVIAPLGVIPPSGTLSVPITVPNLPAAVLGVTVFLQAATCGAIPCALTQPSAVTLLDSSL